MRQEWVIPTRARSATLAVLLSLTVFFLQALIVKHYATNVPFLDEWGIAPFLTHVADGSVRPSEFFAQHNEHRILLARIAFAVLFAIGGEWNLLVFMLFSALLAGLIAGVWSFGLSRLGVPTWLIVLASLVLASPVQVENMLWGFQIQFYTLALCTIVGIMAVALSGRLTWPSVVLAAAAAFGATFSIASGVLAWGVLGLTLVVVATADSGAPRTLLRNKQALMRLGAFAAAGVVILTVFFAGYRFNTGDDVRAQSPAELINWAAVAVSFPLVSNRESFPLWIAGAFALLWAPVVLAVMALLRRRPEAGSRQLLALFTGAGAFVASNAIGIGLGRAHIPHIASRYGTIFLWTSVLSLISMAVVLRSSVHSQKKITGGMAAIALAMGVLLFINYARGLESLDVAAAIHQERELMKASVGGYLSSPETGLAGLIPLPDPQDLLHYLTNPAVQKVLPADLIVPFDVRKSSVSGDAWRPGGTPINGNPEGSWGSWSGSDKLTGRIESPVFRLTQPYMAIPVSGYPSLAGNSLAIEAVGTSAERVTYTGENPGERWATWVPDVSKLSGRDVRIVAIDNSTGFRGWLGLGFPRLLNKTSMAVDSFMHYLEYVAGAVLITGIVLLGFRTPAQEQDPRPEPVVKPDFKPSREKGNRRQNL